MEKERALVTTFNKNQIDCNTTKEFVNEYIPHPHYWITKIILKIRNFYNSLIFPEFIIREIPNPNYKKNQAPHLFPRSKTNKKPFIYPRAQPPNNKNNSVTLQKLIEQFDPSECYRPPEKRSVKEVLTELSNEAKPIKQ